MYYWRRAPVWHLDKPTRRITLRSKRPYSRIERDWTEAGLKKDTKALEKIIGDEWVAIDFQGKTITKAQAIADRLKSASTTNQSVVLGEMKVRVFGNTAVVTGTDVEKSTYKGKDSSGKYAWTDVFVNPKRAVATRGIAIDEGRYVGCKEKAPLPGIRPDRQRRAFSNVRD